MTIDDILKEFSKKFTWVNKENEREEFYEQDVKGVRDFIRSAIKQAFEETKGEKIYIQSHDDNPELEKGYNYAIAHVQRRQQEFLKIKEGE